MVDQLKFNDADMICHVMKVSCWSHNPALFQSPLSNGPQVVFVSYIAGLNIALYNFKNPSLFKSVKALFMHAKTQLAFEVTSEVCWWKLIFPVMNIYMISKSSLEAE